MPAATRNHSSAPPTFARWVAKLCVMLATALPLIAQSDPDPRVAAVTKQVTATLQGFAKKAAQAKAMTRSRHAYQVLVDH
ncbi:MAG: hypothetical protein ACJAYX_004986, partial [Planctomycetota bacterium]